MKYKLLKSLLSISILGSSIFPIGSIMADEEIEGKTNKEESIYRLGPGEEYEIVYTGKKDDTIDVDKQKDVLNKEEDELWYYVSFYNEQSQKDETGYILADDVEIEGYDAKFEKYLFSTSYTEDEKEILRKLHEQNPDVPFDELKVEGDEEEQPETPELPKDNLEMPKASVPKDDSNNVPEKALDKGWIFKDNDWYYYNNQGVMHTDWLLLDGKYYYLDPETGKRVTGWLYDRYYFTSDGVLLTGWQTIDGKTYFFQDNGRKQTGLIQDNGKIYYLYENSLSKNKWRVVNGKEYFFGSDGTAYTNGTYNVGIHKYAFDQQGVMITGWHLKDNKYYYFDPASGRMSIGWLYNRYYFTSDGVLLTGWQTIGGKTYFFESNGRLQEGLIQDNGKVYYSYDGELSINKWRYIGGKQYFFGSDGAAYTNGTYKIGAYKYAFDKNGVMLEGWQLKDNKYYYFDPASGRMSIGWLYDRYYFTSDGVLLTGWQTISGKTYFFESNGRLVKSGLMEDGGKLYYLHEGELTKSKWRFVDGKQYFFGSDGAAYKNGTFKIGAYSYAFDKNGVMLEGWQLKNGKYYYFDPASGRMSIGWLYDRYYFTSDGVLLTGWQTINGKTYFFESNGRVQHGLIKDGGKLYYLYDGVLSKDKWRYIGNNQYFFGSDGAAYTNGIHKVGSYKYGFDKNGAMLTGWNTISSKKYYFDTESGRMAVGYKTINGVEYYFNAEGQIDTKFVKKSDGYTYGYDKNNNLIIDWYIINGQKYFFNARGQMIGDGPVNKVIDVSEHQGVIDWNAVKSSGAVDMVVLRIGYGTYGEDDYFARNLSECRRLGIPYSIYFYSYAENKAEALNEAANVNKIINKYSISKNTPIYYDIENNGYGTTKSEYEIIIPAFINRMESLGYRNMYVYSYTSYLNTVLNSSVILPYVRWVADYDYHCKYSGSYWGWQYSSSERVPGISGNVDMNVWFSKAW